MRRAVRGPLGAAPVGLYAALIDAVGKIRPFQDALAALASSTPPAVVAGAARKDRRVLPEHGPRDDAALLVGADGTPLPPGMPARWLPDRGRGIWSWCERHARWHCRLKGSSVSARIEVTYYVVSAVAIPRNWRSCDEYRVHRRVLNRSLASLTKAQVPCGRSLCSSG